MALDPSDLRLSIEAQVAVPGAASTATGGAANTPYDARRAFDAWPGAPTPAAVATAPSAGLQLPAYEPGSASLTAPRLAAYEPGTASLAGPSGLQPAGLSAGDQSPTTSNDSYTINVSVPGTNANPNDIARAVVSALNSRATRAPQATPRTLVGAR